MKLQLVGLNDYTDTLNWELVIRQVDNLFWGFYRDADHQGVISDSQFDISRRSGSLGDEAIQGWLKEKFSFYALFEENSNQF